MKLTGESKLFIGVIGISIILIGLAVIFFSRPTPPQPALPKVDLIGEQVHTRETQVHLRI